jgi:hypothetical protein
MKKLFVLAVAAIILFSISAPFALAQTDNSVGGCQQAIAQGKPCEIPQTKLNNVGGVLKLIQYITNWMFTGLLVLAVLMIIIAAYHYLFSGGDEEGTGKAKKYLIYTVIAIAVAMLAKGVTFIVAEVLMK